MANILGGGALIPHWLLPIVAFVISFFTSMAGISGAVLLLPFQMSVMGFVSPAVSSTNLVFNVVAIPSGVYRYLRERRLLWPLAILVVAGTVPGTILGTLIRLFWLPDPVRFKAFVGCVLLYMGARLLLDARRKTAAPSDHRWHVQVFEFTWRRLAFHFHGQRHDANTAAILALSLAVGIVGGAYGIGGGAILAPFLVAIFGLPVYAVAGATLLGTFVNSVVGVAFYSGLFVAPDWKLGLLFGLGGIPGMYLGARTQRFVPAFWLKVMLGLILLALALGYLYSWLHAAVQPVSGG